jgi:hypothetical protein
MAIVKRAVKKTDSGERFIAGAPDGRRPRWQKGSKTQITFTVAPAVVDQLDAVCERLHVSRSALMTMWLMERLEREAA